MKTGFSNLRAGMIGVLMIVAVLPGLHALLLTMANGQGGGRPTPVQPTTPARKPTAVPKMPPRRNASPASSTPRQPPCTAQSPTRGTGHEYSENLSGVKLEMVEIPAGSFCMGSPSTEKERRNDEGPQHRVSVGSFYMGKYEVTQAQWQAVMGTNPSKFKGDNLPVENMSWNDAVEFCRKLSRITGKEYRLPTEAEWEYAARAGTTGWYAGNLDAMAWYGSNSGDQTHAVGTKQPNSFGLYDMYGNVRESCQDWYHENYNGAPSDGRAWESVGKQKYRVLRGCSWYHETAFCRSAFRYSGLMDVADDLDGFRVVAIART